MLLKVMVAVRRRWLQRTASGELRDSAETCSGNADVSPKVGSESESLRWRKLERPARAEENDMNRVELQRILGYSRFSSAVFVNIPVSETA
jgi:hypothetical protein